MDSRFVLELYIRVLKCFALMWPAKNGSISYTYLLTWVGFFNFIVKFPYSILQIVLWVDSTDEIIDHFIVTFIMVAIEKLNVLGKKKTFMELLLLMIKLDWINAEYEKNFIISHYISSWTSVLISDIMADAVHLMCLSTYRCHHKF